MSIFAAAAQKQIRELTGTLGLRSLSLGEVLGVRGFSARRLWPRALGALAKMGLAVMDTGAMIVGVGWRIVLYGFFGWAGVGILRNMGRIAGVVGAEILRSIPEVSEPTESPA